MLLTSTSPLFAPPPLVSWLRPSASHAVVGVKLRLDVADASQQLAQHRLPVTAVTGLDTTHTLGRVAVHLHRTVAMGAEGLEGETVLIYK